MVAHGKTTQVSTRVTQADAEFLTELVMEGASTPSDKLRGLISEARQHREELGDYKGSLRQIRRLIGPTVERVLEVENGGLPHSELVTPLIEWLSETLAFVLSQVPQDDEEPVSGTHSAHALEAGLADRVMGLSAQILRLGVTEDAQCYDPKAISSRLQPVLDIARVINASRANEGQI